MSINIDDEVVIGNGCVECGKAFKLMESEQTFYIQRRLDLPKRCARCRAERRSTDLVGGVSAAPPKERSVVINEVECHHCGRVTVVPFIPRAGREAYCRVCWEGIKNVVSAGAVYV